MYRKTYVEIDCEALENNIKNIIENYDGYKYYIGVVKANAYSHGFESIKYILKGGVNYLATSSLEEALKVRSMYKETPILVLEPIHYDDILVAAKNNITVTIDNKDIFNSLLENKIKVKFHLKIDSGMNRFGIKDKETVKYIMKNSNKDTYLEGIFTHLSTGCGVEFQKEKNRFEELTSLIDLNEIDIVHLERSLTMQQHEKLPYDNGCRLGISMYGFTMTNPSPSLKRKIYNMLTFKKPVVRKTKLNTRFTFKFFTEVIEVKEVKKGEIVGYAGMYDAKENMKIAILPYGFADYLYINPSYVVIKGKKYKILTNYMDITTILIDDEVSVGDKVEIFGDKISVREAAGLAHQNAYKTMCSVTNRVPRVYVYKDERIVKEY